MFRSITLLLLLARAASAAHSCGHTSVVESINVNEPSVAELTVESDAIVVGEVERDNTVYTADRYTLGRAFVRVDRWILGAGGAYVSVDHLIRADGLRGPDYLFATEFKEGDRVLLFLVDAFHATRCEPIFRMALPSSPNEFAILHGANGRGLGFRFGLGKDDALLDTWRNNHPATLGKVIAAITPYLPRPAAVGGLRATWWTEHKPDGTPEWGIIQLTNESSAPIWIDSYGQPDDAFLEIRAPDGKLIQRVEAWANRRAADWLVRPRPTADDVYKLEPGATYGEAVFPANLDLRPGSYRSRIVVEHKAVERGHPVWTGTVVSNELPFQVVSAKRRGRR
jgi:hypothetical protein